MPDGTPRFNGMPPDLEKIFAAIWQDVGNLDLCWTAFCQLYGKSPERIKLLARYGVMFGARSSRPSTGTSY